MDFTTLSSRFWEDWNNPFDDYSSNENIKNSTATLLTRVWVRCRGERCGNLKMENFWTKWELSRTLFWCGEENLVYSLQSRLKSWLQAAGTELNTENRASTSKFIHSRIQYNSLTAVSCKKKLLFCIKETQTHIFFVTRQINLTFVLWLKAV